MPNLILDLMVDRVDLVDEGANSAAFIRLYKRKETDKSMLTFDEILAKMKPEHASVIQDTIAKAKADAKERAETDAQEKAETKAQEDKEKMDGLEEDVKKAKKELEDLKLEIVAKSKPNEPDFEEVMKGLDPTVQEIFKSMKAQKEAAETVARQAAEKAVKEEAIAKAKELKALPVEEAKLVEVMKGISPEIHEILKAANKAVEDAGLLDEVGKSKGSTVPNSGGSADVAWANIEKAAAKIEADEKITKAKAITKAIQQNPDLYREYLKGGAN